MDHKKVILADVVRTPWGKPCGSMEKLLSSDLAAATIQKLLARAGIEPSAVDQVVFGQAHPSTYPNNIGHFAWLKAGLPVEVPGYTVQSNTGSALQAVRNAYYLIASGNEGIVIAGGADSYSAAPFVMRNVRRHFDPQDRRVIDTLDEAERCTQPRPMSRQEQYEAAHGKQLSGQDLEFAAESRNKAERFSGVCGDGIVPVCYTERKKGEITVSDDEWLKGQVSADSPLAPYADGAAVALLMSEEKALELHIAPSAEILGFAVSGCSPATPSAAGLAAVQKLLRVKGRTMDDIACLEVMENSAEDVFDIVQALGGKGKVNPFGGAMAYGKNDGADGIAMLQRLTASLRAGEYGIACIYGAGGLGMAVLLQKC